MALSPIGRSLGWQKPALRVHEKAAARSLR
jgi:hypothetical protein